MKRPNRSIRCMKRDSNQFSVTIPSLIVIAWLFKIHEILRTERNRQLWMYERMMTVDDLRLRTRLPAKPPWWWRPNPSGKKFLTNPSEQNVSQKAESKNVESRTKQTEMIRVSESFASQSGPLFYNLSKLHVAIFRIDPELNIAAKREGAEWSF